MNPFLAAVMGCAAAAVGSCARADSPVPGGVAVVELFTSEGCSSCPPADTALADLVRDARAKGTAVYPIAWHVDYWNHLGWSDPFSTSAASARQRAYATAMKVDRVYTPQMIVNGREGFVGSDAERRGKAITAALATPAAVRVRLTLDRPAVDRVVASYATEHAAAGAKLEVVAVERGLQSDVTRGENGGHVLRHENVARASETIDLTGHADGHVTLTLPPGIKPADVSVVAFVQDAHTLAVTGATAVDLPTTVAGK